ncbi:MAG: tetratricopeptide repeat protein, partial [Abditibacteriaceae bacterium]
ITVSHGAANIQWTSKISKNPAAVEELAERADKHAKKGNYARAIEVYERVLLSEPDRIEARRNLGMAYLESGQLELAKQRLAEVTRIAPNDEWAFLLLANLFAKYEDNPSKAARFYSQAYALNPNDPYLLCSYGGNLIKTGKVHRGRELFERAKTIDPTYPNSYYGIALVSAEGDEKENALSNLDELFARPKSTDLRSEPVYAAARELYLSINKEIAEQSYDEFMRVIDDRKIKLEQKEGGNVIEIQEDNSLETDAVAQMAWNHNTDRHRIKYRNKTSAITPHLVAHELEHIYLEQQARAAGRNRAFATTVSTQEFALQSISNDISKMQRTGYTESDITAFILQLVGGLAGQIFNIPLDMIIEYRLYHG